MKKLILIALIALAFGAKAQIVFEHKYDSASTFGVFDTTNSNSYASQLMIVDFEMSGPKYVKICRIGMFIEIYNLNHSFNRRISYASYPQACNRSSIILYLSENLFDLDSKMEFMYLTPDCGGNIHTYIYKEDGTCMFHVDSLGPYVMVNTPQAQCPIYNTPSGTKMILSHQNNRMGYANVYGLQGSLSTSISKSNDNLISFQLSNPYPNPAINSTRVDYKLPDNVNQGTIVFYDLNGTEIKHYKVDNTFDHLLISTVDLPAGSYYYQLQTNNQNSGGKKLVVIK
jgi:hypothetical protein